jgi:hypothetical protein
VRHLTLGAIAVLAALAAVVGGPDRAEPASAAKVRIVDRTLRCNVPLDAGIRLVRISGQSGVKDQADPSRWFAIAGVHLTIDNGQLALIQAGTPRVETGAPQVDATFLLNRQACKPASARIALSPRGLGGGSLNQFVEYYECTMPRRILLRVRAEFRAPATLRSQGGSQFSEAPLSKGYVAIQSERAKPLLYTDVVESGRARLFSGNCQRD